MALDYSIRHHLTNNEHTEIFFNPFHYISISTKELVQIKFYQEYRAKNIPSKKRGYSNFLFLLMTTVFNPLTFMYKEVIISIQKMKGIQFFNP